MALTDVVMPVVRLKFPISSPETTSDRRKQAAVGVAMLGINLDSKIVENNMTSTTSHSSICMDGEYGPWRGLVKASKEILLWSQTVQNSVYRNLQSRLGRMLL